MCQRSSLCYIVLVGRGVRLAKALPFSEIPKDPAASLLLVAAEMKGIYCPLSEACDVEYLSVVWVKREGLEVNIGLRPTQAGSVDFRLKYVELYTGADLLGRPLQELRVYLRVRESPSNSLGASKTPCASLEIDWPKALASSLAIYQVEESPPQIGNQENCPWLGRAYEQPWARSDIPTAFGQTTFGTIFYRSVTTLSSRKQIR